MRLTGHLHIAKAVNGEAGLPNDGLVILECIAICGACGSKVAKIRFSIRIEHLRMANLHRRARVSTHVNPHPSGDILPDIPQRVSIHWFREIQTPGIEELHALDRGCDGSDNLHLRGVGNLGVCPCRVVEVGQGPT